MKLKWSNKLFDSVEIKKRKTKKIGHDVFISSRFKGKFGVINGMCIMLKNKKSISLTSSIVIKRENVDASYFVNIPIYLTGALKFNIIGMTYGYKVNSSKLLSFRIKN